MTVSTNSFIFGVDKEPSWFTTEAQQGRVEYIYSNNQLSGAKLKGFKGTIQDVSIGDMIIEQGVTMLVVPKAAVKQYVK